MHPLEMLGDALATFKPELQKAFASRPLALSATLAVGAVGAAALLAAATATDSAPVRRQPQNEADAEPPAAVGHGGPESDSRRS